jgi:predicted lysophospholipase L1 biosynthesis ABC-type transport system permease subunit
MKAICEGRTTRQEVVRQNLEQYRTVFNRTAQQINVLKSVSQYCSTLVLCSRVAYVRYSRPSENMSWEKRITAEAYSTQPDDKAW